MLLILIYFHSPLHYHVASANLPGLCVDRVPAQQQPKAALRGGLRGAQGGQDRGQQGRRCTVSDMRWCLFVVC